MNNYVPTTDDVDDTVTLERPDGAGGTVFSAQVTAQLPDQYSLSVNTEQYFQSVADVSALVISNGPGAYRVSGLSLADIYEVDKEISWASWTLVVFLPTIYSHIPLRINHGQLMNGFLRYSWLTVII